VCFYSRGISAWRCTVCSSNKTDIYDNSGRKKGESKVWPSHPRPLGAAAAPQALQINEGYTRIHVGPCTVLVHPMTLKESGFEDGSIVKIRKMNNGVSQSDTAVTRVHASGLVAEDSVGECIDDQVLTKELRPGR